MAAHVMHEWGMLKTGIALRLGRSALSAPNPQHQLMFVVANTNSQEVFMLRIMAYFVR